MSPRAFCRGAAVGGDRIGRCASFRSPLRARSVAIAVRPEATGTLAARSRPVLQRDREIDRDRSACLHLNRTRTLADALMPADDRVPPWWNVRHRERAVDFRNGEIRM